MSKKLPPNPNLEQLSKQAKDLLKAHRKGDASVCERLRTLHRFSGASDGDILAAKITLIDAQFVLAMEYGFKTWNEMKSFVKSSKNQGPFKEIEDLGAMSDRGFRLLIQEAGPVGKEVVCGLLAMPPQIFGRFWKKLSPAEQDGIQEDWRLFAHRCVWQTVRDSKDELVRLANGLAQQRKEEIYTEGEEWRQDWEKETVVG